MNTFFILLALTTVCSAHRSRESSSCKNAKKYGPDKETLKELRGITHQKTELLEIIVSPGVKITSAANTVPTELVSEHIT